MKKHLLWLGFLLFVQCDTGKVSISMHEPFLKEVRKDSSSFFFSAPRERSAGLSIGIFDSGTGGLSILEKMLQEQISGTDQSLRSEHFIYLADQANMPYSNYAETGKVELLVEHIFKDALFLLNGRSHDPITGAVEQMDSRGIKALVIACNTATAYGIDKLDAFLDELNIDVPVFGVIESASKGALELVDPSNPSLIVVFATPATVMSGAYKESVMSTATLQNKSDLIQILQHGGKGLHESIDQKRAFIREDAVKVYPEYMGPAISDSLYPVEIEKLSSYRFDTAQNRLLFNGPKPEKSDTIQLNSVENYVRYHLYSILEKAKASESEFPVRSIILGCTHYPFVAKEIHQILEEYRIDSEFSSLIADTVYLIDPAENTSKLVLDYLQKENLRHPYQPENWLSSNFYISIPNAFEPTVELDERGAFTYEYQYLERSINQGTEYTLYVPFSREYITGQQIERIAERFPHSYEAISRQLD